MNKTNLSGDETTVPTEPISGKANPTNAAGDSCSLSERTSSPSQALAEIVGKTGDWILERLPATGVEFTRLELETEIRRACEEWEMTVFRSRDEMAVEIASLRRQLDEANRLLSQEVRLHAVTRREFQSQVDTQSKVIEKLQQAEAELDEAQKK